jgi:hypothetical protein
MALPLVLYGNGREPPGRRLSSTRIRRSEQVRRAGHSVKLNVKTARRVTEVTVTLLVEVSGRVTSDLPERLQLRSVA